MSLPQGDIEWQHTYDPACVMVQLLNEWEGFMSTDPGPPPEHFGDMMRIARVSLGGLGDTYTDVNT